MAAGLALDESDVVIVGAGGAGQDAHEVTVIAEVFEKAGHPPEHTTNGGERKKKKDFCNASHYKT